MTTSNPSNEQPLNNHSELPVDPCAARPAGGYVAQPTAEEIIASASAEAFNAAFEQLRFSAFLPTDTRNVVRLVKLADHPLTFEAVLFKQTDVSKPTWPGPTMDPARIRYFEPEPDELDAYRPVVGGKVAIDPNEVRALARLTCVDSEVNKWVISTIRPQPLINLFQLGAMLPETIPLGVFLEEVNGRTGFSAKETIAVLHELDVASWRMFKIGPRQRALRMRIED